MLNERDRNVLEHILEYCNEIEETITAFDNTLKTLKANNIYKNAVSMCVLQIGELTTHFSKKFLETNTQVPWSKMKAMRNVAAHGYKRFSIELLHEVLIVKIPELKKYCLELLEEK